ncbi:uncharacterized protein LOC142983150 [Anticarsia gemmatalis]|uniref:uncharacterized protein LOC142983149 n=1 Tax=Anticarsia gemmatalis TaxID=129554 RepID=UPI003F76638A
MVNCTYKCLLLLFIVVSFVIAMDPVKYSLDNADRLFEHFIETYKKTYASEQEKAERFEIFKSNLLESNHLNEASDNAVFGITKFSDLTKEEFAKFGIKGTKA